MYRGLRPGPDDYVNPILAGYFPDPSIVRVGEDFYLVNSTFAHFPGIPVHHSRDLVNWTQIGNVIDRPSQLDFDSLGVSRGVFAPTIEYHAPTKTFYVLNTCVDCGGNFLVTATNPAGPWSDPVWLRGVGGIDPSIFFDDDGRAYILNNDAPPERPRYEGHRAIWIREYDLAARRVVGEKTVLVNGGIDIATKPIWIEGPHIYKKDGKYYLVCAEGGTAVGHSQVVLRSDRVTGPYEPWSGNPILTQRHLDPARPFPITSAGHADLVELPNGDWWATFLAVRPYEGDRYNTGRETFLMPVRWTPDGWPVITSGTEQIPYVAKRPALPLQRAPTPPTHGNFTHRDELEGPELGMHWLMVRTPRERWWDFTTAPGALTLRARPQHLGEPAQPSFVGRRQQHQRATATTAMRYAPAKSGDVAGLVAFQNDWHFYLLGVSLDDEGRPAVRLWRRAGKMAEANGTLVASTPVRIEDDAPIFLRIVARGGRYDFFYATRPDRWTRLHGDDDATILSTEKAGGFVGTLLGLYAYTDGR